MRLVSSSEILTVPVSVESSTAEMRRVSEVSASVSLLKTASIRVLSSSVSAASALAIGASFSPW